MLYMLPYHYKIRAMQRTTKVLFGGAVLVAALLFLYLFGFGGASRTTNLVVSISNTSPASEDGDLVLVIEKIELWSEEQGWTELSDTETTVNLSDVAQKPEWTVVADERLAPGTFDRVRLIFDEVLLVERDGTSTALKTISNHLSLDGAVVVESEQNTSINIDILESLSRYTTREGTTLFIPSAKLESRTNASISLSEEEEAVTVREGTVTVSQTFGMDESGIMRPNYRLPQTARIEERGGSIQIDAPIVVDPQDLLPPVESITISEEPEGETLSSEDNVPDPDTEEESGESVDEPTLDP